MSKPKKTVSTAYGRLDGDHLQQLQDSYDTRGLLSIIEELDELVGQIQGDGGLRDMLLNLHAMAHTVVNDAPWTGSKGQDDLPQLASGVSTQLHEAASQIRNWIAQVQPLEGLMPDD